MVQYRQFSLPFPSLNDGNSNTDQNDLDSPRERGFRNDYDNVIFALLSNTEGRRGLRNRQNVIT